MTEFLKVKNIREILKPNALLIKLDYVSITHDWEPVYAKN